MRPINIYVAEIPVFKERRMTATNKDSGTLSYNIKDSYAGILRLSPNNTPSLSEKDGHANISEDLLNYITFSDSVADLLSSQFIRVSTSDGVMLDMRIGADGIEYDNLYVLGALKTPAVVTYGSFEMGGNKLPSLYNSRSKVSSGPALTVDNNGIKAPEITVDNLEDTYIPVNIAKDGEPAVFEFKNIVELVGPILEEELSTVSTLPTGSIHWIPVNLEQYEALLNKEGNSHNGSQLYNNTLIRDFLLCDGSTYESKDFPELAKILYGEKVVKWKENVTKQCMERKEIISGKNENGEDNYTFTVPDLRSMFIEYLVPSIKKANDEKNRAGHWEIDSCKDQDIIIRENSDKHFHYIVLDNSIKEKSNTCESSSSTEDGVNYVFNLGTEKPLAKYGSMKKNDTNISHCKANPGCDRKCCFTGGKTMISRIYPRQTDITSYCSVASNSCGYILTGNYDPNPSIKIGLSSPANYSVKVDNVLNYTKSAEDNKFTKLSQIMHDSIYKNEKEYVEYGNTLKELRGKENTPEFYACLPLIKI